MTISVTVASVTYNGSGSTGPFAVSDGGSGIYYGAASELVLTKTSTTGVESTLTLGVDYTVSGTNTASGTVTLTIALAVGETLRIERATPLTQGVALSSAGTFNPAEVMAALDKLTRIAQDTRMQMARDAVTDQIMKLNAAGATNYWDADTHIIRNIVDPVANQDAATKAYVDGIAFGVAVSAFVSTLMDDADAAAFLTTLGVSVNAQTILGQTFAQMRASLDLEAGTDFYSISAADAAIAAAVAALSSVYQPLNSNLTSIAALTTTSYGRALLELANAAALTAALDAFVGDSGAGGTKGLVPAPVSGDANKFLRGDGTFQTIPGGGDALTSGTLAQFAATTSDELRGVISNETGTGALVFATSPTLVTPALGTPASGTLTNCTGLPVAGGGTGLASATAYAVLCGGTSSTGALQSIAGVGTSGQVLTSNGAGALPTFQSASGLVEGTAVASTSGTSIDFTSLSVTTAARPSHILALKWPQIDLDIGIVDFRDKTQDESNKRRPRVPINQTARTHLELAKQLARTDYVIEFRGEGALGSIKKGVKEAARRAGIEDVTPYVLRHTAGVWMAKAGIPMQEIAAYMGHTDLKTTMKHYAHFHPSFLRTAASALEISPPMDLNTGGPSRT